MVVWQRFVRKRKSGEADRKFVERSQAIAEAPIIESAKKREEPASPVTSQESSGDGGRASLSTITQSAEVVATSEASVQERSHEETLPIIHVRKPAGRLRAFLPNWEALTSDKTIISWVKGYKIPFVSKPLQYETPKENCWSREEISRISSKIEELLQKGAIEQCESSLNQFVSSIFLRQKPDGSYRLILNLKKLNEFVASEHFKLEDHKTASRLINKNWFMASIDLKDAYYLIPIADSDKRFLRFKFDKKLFQFTCLPFGLTSAPYVFTKIIKPVISTLRRKGFLSVVYLDDFLLLGRTREECELNVSQTLDFLRNLGFIINKEKSRLSPAQCCKYLGFIFDSRRMSIVLPPEKKSKIEQLTLKFGTTRGCKIRDFAKMVGSIVSCCPAVKYGFAHTKSLEREKFLALEKNNGNYDALMKLSNNIKEDLLWWRLNVQKSQNSLKMLDFQREIFSDSSLTGWGAAYRNETARGSWNAEERACHINFLELKAAFFGLKCFAKHARGIDILLRIDNTTAISYINRMGGVQYPRLNQITQEIWRWCEERNIILFASYISSKDNFVADAESRKAEPETEFELANEAFEKIVEKFGKPTIDLFASRINAKCEKYFSWFKDPNSTAVDAFTKSWHGLNFYAFPPFAIILKVLRKIKNEKAEGIVVVPEWPAQPWFPLFYSMSISEPIYLKPNINLLISCNREPHPLWRNLTLVVAKLSGKDSN